MNRFSPAQLSRLLDTSRRNNGQRAITGMLLYKDGNFMQVIEGGEADIRGLCAKLQLDPRHTGFLTLLEEKIVERSFQDWSMGFKNLDEADQSLDAVEGYADFRGLSFMNESFAAQPSRAKKLLNMFWQTM